MPLQVAFLIMYGHLPNAEELANWDEALMRHSAIPKAVEDAVAALPHDAHFMGTVLTAINALSTCHPEQNPALAGQNVYQSKEMQDKQIVRLIGAADLYSAGMVSHGGQSCSASAEHCFVTKNSSAAVSMIGLCSLFVFAACQM